MANWADLITNISEFMAEVYDLNLIPVEARFGNTAAHITRRQKLEGEKWHVKAFDTPYSRARVSSDLEADMPDAGKVAATDISITDTDLRQLAGSVAVSIPAMRQTENDSASALDLAVQKVLEVEEDIGEKRNALIHQGANPIKAIVNAIYNEDGTPYTPGQKDAFIQINTGSAAGFHRGEYLEIIDAGDGIARCVVEVDDVEPGKRWRHLNIGPGLRVTLADGTGAYVDENTGTGDADANLDNVIATDWLRRHDDSATGGFPGAFGSLCPTSFAGALAYFSVADRRAAGYAFLLPEYGYYGAAGAPATLDIDVHFGDMADTLAYVLGKSRIKRRGRGIEFTDAIVASARPEIVRFATLSAGDPGRRFNVIQPGTLSEAERRKLVAVYGWDGLLLKLPNLPPIALQVEALARENTIDVFDPSAFTWLHLGDGRPEWLPGEYGGKWSLRRNVTTGNRTLTFDAAAVCWETLFCETPRAAFYDILNVEEDYT